jgi:hypothetical protein
MPEYTIELLWTCSTCEFPDNLGLSRNCKRCGKTKDAYDVERFPEDLTAANALTGEKDQKAKAGPDWICKYCGTLQNSLERCCENCGGDKLGTKKLYENVDTSAVSSATTEEELQKTSKISKLKTLIQSKYIIGLFLVGAFALIFSLIFRTKIVDTQVFAVAWEHNVIIDRYQVYRRDGWDPESKAFDISNEGKRIHHYDRVKVGSHREPYKDRYQCGEDCHTVRGSCYTTPIRCSNNKNGSGSCSGGDRVCSPDYRSCSPKYCTRTAYKTVDDFEDQPRYRNWYSWKVWDWGYNRTVKHSGTSIKTSWPKESELVVPLAEGEQERRRQEASYKVTFSDDEQEKYSIEPKTLSEFRRYDIGSRYKLKVSFANIEVIK